MQHSHVDALLQAACPYVSVWLCLAMQPAKMAIDPLLLVQAKNVPKVSFRESRQATGLENCVVG